MRQIQSKVLPDNWMQIVQDFDVESSLLSTNDKEFACLLVEKIKIEKEALLMNALAKKLICHIVFETTFLGKYDLLPFGLIKEGLCETRGSRGINFNRKLHSVFIEFITYKKLSDRGYTIKNYQRREGSCDLVMLKNNCEYNFEVKFKESQDIRKSRLYDYIEGMSLLKRNLFLRGRTYEIHIKSYQINDDAEKAIMQDMENFILNKKYIFSGKYIDIFDAKKRRELHRDITTVASYINSLTINQDLMEVDDIYELIRKIFICKNGHITKLKKKSEKFNDFYGCLVWDIPFHVDANIGKIEMAFKKLNLSFNLYVFIGGIGNEEYDFLLSKHINEPI